MEIIIGSPDSKWMPASAAPEGAVVETKIDDGRGVRNVGLLKREGRLWFLPDGSMYVYYTPTHFRPVGGSDNA